MHTLSVESVRRDSKIVLHGERDARGLMSLQLGQGNIDIATRIRMVQIVPRIEAATPGDLYPDIPSSASQVTRVFELHKGLEGAEGVNIPSGDGQGLFQRCCHLST